MAKETEIAADSNDMAGETEAWDIKERSDSIFSSLQLSP
jgi:hypothetical protein